MKISILLPAYNEEHAIGKVLDDIKNAMEKTEYSDNYEILVIDDNSRDKTAEISESKGARVIRRKINGGSGASRKTGIIEAKGEIIAMLDADDTYSAEDIPKMLNFFPEYDQVNGARDSEQGAMKFLRVPAKWTICKIASFLSGVKIPDLNTGLKAFKKDLMIKYMWVIPDGFSCVTTMTLAFLCNGHNVKYIPTKYKKRMGKSKFHPVKDTYKYLQTVLRIIIYFNPFKIFFPISLSLIFLAFLILFYSIFYMPNIMDITVLVLFITSLQIFSLGIIAELIVKNKNQNN